MDLHSLASYHRSPTLGTLEDNFPDDLCQERNMSSRDGILKPSEFGTLSYSQ